MDVHIWSLCIVVLTLVSCLLVADANHKVGKSRPKRWWWTTTSKPPLSILKSTAPLRYEYETHREGWIPSAFPNPQKQPERCAQGSKPSWVCDPNRVLGGYTADEINEQLEDQARLGKCQCRKTTCSSNPSHRGIQGAVAIVSKMDFGDRIPSFEEQNESAERFAKYLNNDDWRFGLCDDDYTIFISVDEREVFTAVGVRAREVLTGECLNEVQKEAKSQISMGSVAEAIRYMIRQYSDMMEAKHPCNKSKSGGSGGWLGSISGIVGGIVESLFSVVGIACCVGIGCCCYWRKGGAQQITQAMSALVDRFRSSRGSRSKAPDKKGAHVEVSQVEMASV